jgi:hypothetical protein
VYLSFSLLAKAARLFGPFDFYDVHILRLGLGGEFVHEMLVGKLI